MATNKRTQIEEAAYNVGLVVGSWHPGDGVTRYRFFRETANPDDGDYFGGSHPIITVLGRKAAMAFIEAYKAGRAAGIGEAIAEIRRSEDADQSFTQTAVNVGHLLDRGPFHFGELMVPEDYKERAAVVAARFERIDY